MTTFGQIIANKRKALKISQKNLATTIRKEDGSYISAQYLNDIEHDRRNPPGEYLIKQIAIELDIDIDYLLFLAGTFAEDIRKLGITNPERVTEFFKAFRRDVKKQ